MILDPESQAAGAVYRFLISVVVPRPIAFVSTVGGHGFNVAPFSYFMPITSRPPLLGISIAWRDGGPKDTLRNVRETGDFVINIVPESLAERMVAASGDWPAESDEFQVAGLTPVPAERVKSPRVAECPVHLECRLFQEVLLGDSTLVVGQLVLAHVDDALLTDGRVDPRRLRALGRLGSNQYATLGEVLEIDRPKIERHADGAPPAKS